MNCHFSASGESPIQRAVIEPDNDVIKAAEIPTATGNNGYFPIKTVYCMHSMVYTVYKMRIVVKRI